MKNQKILRKLEDLNLFKKITVHVGGNVEATLRDKNINDTDFRHLLMEFKAKKFNLNLTTIDGQLVLKITQIPSLRAYHTHPVFAYDPAQTERFPIGVFGSHLFPFNNNK